ncbi:PP2C family protein-serine/threonine phosphatase [Halanaerobacter jeridensis]|uniref:PP2C family protein-serine/threonine phosphatase n=1 Tax=Halanaerobacter jeridensis TaxID=706427 RepID=UPI00195D40FD|nr:SpoIIE family protein phosphatase [Halanaerobacter jeridensis]
MQQTQKRLDEELAKAAKLHESFFPNDSPEISGLSFGTYYSSAHELGGDFYNFIELEDEVLFYLIDVAGHGLDGALLNVFLRETINNYLLDNKNNISLVELLEYINYSYRGEAFPDDYFFCVSFFLLDKETKEITFSNGGFHITPCLISSQGKINDLKVHGLPISKSIPVSVYDFSTSTIKLLPGTTLFATSDGLIEEENETGRYGKERVKDLLLANKELSPQKLLDLIEEDLKSFITNDNFQDDITCLILKNT